jgi:hypothetical protein
LADVHGIEHAAEASILQVEPHGAANLRLVLANKLSRGLVVAGSNPANELSKGNLFPHDYLPLLSPVLFTPTEAPLLCCLARHVQSHALWQRPPDEVSHQLGSASDPKFPIQSRHILMDRGQAYPEPVGHLFLAVSFKQTSQGLPQPQRQVCQARSIIERDTDQRAKLRMKQVQELQLARAERRFADGAMQPDKVEGTLGRQSIQSVGTMIHTDHPAVIIKTDRSVPRNILYKLAARASDELPANAAQRAEDWVSDGVARPHEAREYGKFVSGEPRYHGMKKSDGSTWPGPLDLASIRTPGVKQPAHTRKRVSAPLVGITSQLPAFTDQPERLAHITEPQFARFAHPPRS